MIMSRYVRFAAMVVVASLAEASTRRSRGLQESPDCVSNEPAVSGVTEKTLFGSHYHEPPQQLSPYFLLSP